MSSAPAQQQEKQVSNAHDQVLKTLITISEAMGSNLELPAVLETILEQTMTEMRAQEGSILLFNEHQDRLEMLASRGLPEAIVQRGYIPRKGSIAEYVIEHKHGLILNDAPQTKPDNQKTYKALDGKRQILSSMCVPLRVQGRVLGAINLNRTLESCGDFQEDDLGIADLLACHAASCVEQSRLHAANLKSERLAAIGQTVAGISHCVKNMLTGIRGGMSLMDMATQNQDWGVQGKGADILKRNLERLSEVVLDMLDYSKEREPIKKPTGVYGLLVDVASNVQSKADTLKVTQEVAVAEDCGDVPADTQQLFRCILNLAQNALDVSPEGGRVLYTAERTEDPRTLRRMKDRTATAAIVIRVADSGPGIDADNMKVIFEPFFSTKGSKGTGLGLACTRKVIEEHGGHIEVASPPNQPAVFAISLPV